MKEPKPFEKVLDDLDVQIHFKENSIPSIHAGKLTEESKQAILTALATEIEGVIPDEKVGTVAVGLNSVEIGYNIAVEDFKRAATERGLMKEERK